MKITDIVYAHKETLCWLIDAILVAKKQDNSKR